MSRRRMTRALAAALSVAAISATTALAAPGDCREITPATDTTAAVTACRQDVWLHAGNKVGNVEAPTWNTTPPAASVTGGAGGGYAGLRLADIAEARNPNYRPTFSGSFTGTLDNLAATLYLAAPVYQATDTAFPLLATLKVDGEIIFEQEAVEVDVPLQPAGQATDKIQFALTGIAAEMASYQMPNAADTEHTVELSVINRYWGDGHTVFLYDTTEVPSGFIFNLETDPASLKPYTQIPIVPAA